MQTEILDPNERDQPQVIHRFDDYAVVVREASYVVMAVDEDGQIAGECCHRPLTASGRASALRWAQEAQKRATRRREALRGLKMDSNTQEETDGEED